MLHVISLSIVLHLSNLAGAPPSVVSRAQSEVTRVYAAIGVPVRWDTSASAVAGAMHIVLLPNETGVLRHASDTVMGAAVRTPRGTGVAYVYYRRVQEQSARHEVSTALVLACAMSHELGHLLGARDHAPEGLMRACWRRAEFIQAERGQLRFSTAEAAGIRARMGMESEALVEDDGGDGSGNQLE
jgi:hypothetical protein